MPTLDGRNVKVTLKEKHVDGRDLAVIFGKYNGSQDLKLKDQVYRRMTQLERHV